MRKLSTLVWASLLTPAIALAATALTWQDILDAAGRFAWCLLIIEWIFLLAAVVAIVCIRTCNEERECIIRCLRIYIWITILIPIVIIVCFLL